MKDSKMNTQSNRSLDASEINVPEQEISTPVGRSVHGELETHPEQVDDNRAADLAASAPQLPWWISEKYFWMQGAAGSFYLKPFDEYLNYTVEKSYLAAQRGLEVCFPGGSHDKTQEAAIVKSLSDEVRAMHESMVALNGLEGNAFTKFLVDRCLRNAVYAATTQFELVNWAAREAAKGNDASTNTNYGEKASRKTTFMITAGALLALINDAFPGADVSKTAFQKMAKRVIYDTARIEGDKLKTPAQMSTEAKAGVEAARITVEDF
jgi:hypothetical protein